MATVSLAEAKAHLSALVDRVIAGEAVTITRRGREVVRLSAVSEPKRKVDLDALRAVTAQMPFQDEGAADFIRAMRDDERY
ncbi:hypothetical protein AFCDBAGC_0811 [Methylobacterium cerastii]|uniref:Antitoxin n=1 Tax=Methylobacterium cerastii TaxID=932741 RepID=A0ABQ4QD15_9HYPH|nr:MULTISPECIES: type II toxin-antitoxin system prevent-host-death family antitoxin [Methylobacterium]TXN07761.1 type II toxin-antitoxin system prevent-host-death family antitoxin [Methylobacterium sp. WL122]TXM66706.1 type II toxin-antitoxin system prevent-host-death family antitoxin [Methylobacterium sp. WL120]TXM75726.1 type II toxin-antitoxin system prevent-host-death family antitoxin [Methylobacterium sp. WL12]TXN04444.1 type II toxin-antitoxin system prevent-host-death family antitoxin [M